MPIEIGFTFGMRRSKNTYSMELEKTFLLLKHLLSSRFAVKNLN